MMKILRSFQVAVMDNKILTISLCGSLFLLSACQSEPVAIEKTIVQPTPQLSVPQPYTTPSGVTIIPYDLEPITRKSLE